MTVGFDNLAINHQLLLGLTFEEATGAVALDRAKPHHPMTLTGPPTWTQLPSGLMVLDFNSATPDYLQCSAALTADLNFTSGDFSAAAWVYFDEIVNDILIIGRSNSPAFTDGWDFKVTARQSIDIYTCQAGIYQNSFSDDDTISAGTWCLIGITRSGESGRVLKNGCDITYWADTHIDPLTATRTLLIGVAVDLSHPFDGKMWNPRIWGRKLTTADWMNLFQTERHWFGV